MATKLLWTALVTFARGTDKLHLLPDWAEGGSGWLVAFADGADEALALFARDLERCGLQEIEVDQLQRIDIDDIVDEHLVANVRNMESGKRTAWGTIHCY